MSFDDNDFSDENDWGDDFGAEWKEFDWQRYLADSISEVERFAKTYLQTPAGLSRIDEAAAAMGWDSTDWTVEEVNHADNEEEADDSSEAASGFGPFTVHQHPIYLAARGLVLVLRLSWEDLLTARLAPPDPGKSWLFGRMLHGAEMEAVLAAQAVEYGDVELAVCHFKQMLLAVNQGMALLPEVTQSRARLMRAFEATARAAFFDLRELALRVISECREEARRRPSDLE